MKFGLNQFKNKKVILVCGYSRGGTNIVWNLLQSHPDITSPIHETGTILRKKDPLKFSRAISLFRKAGILKTTLAKKVIDHQLHKYKMQTLEHSENRFKNQDQLYKKDEVSESTLCLKSVDYDIYLTDLLLSIYSDLYIIFVSRNGYAVSESHIRRGENVESVSKLYNKIYERMRFYLENHSKSTLIKFEDALQDPFEMAIKLLKFCECDPTELQYLRLKSKKTISKSGQHDAEYGAVDKKYWFDKESINQIIVEDINTKQIDRLDQTSIEIINRNAGDALAYFGYEIID